MTNKTPTPTGAPGPLERIPAIDVVRGIVMVLMVLDHARDFWGGFRPSPTDLQVTSAPLFFTRWVTHLCAPLFVFLTGLSAFLHVQRHGLGATRRFLLTRGVMLILFELLLFKFAWAPELGYSFVLVQVIWVLGVSMIVLAGLTCVSPPILLALSVLLVGGHNLLDGIQAHSFGQASWVWTLLHQRGLMRVGGVTFFISYPLMPWLGVIGLGYSFGRLFTAQGLPRERVLLLAGSSALMLFMLLRATSLYGDPSPWGSHPRGALFTVISFLNVTKYPPSLLFLLLTLGVGMFLFLGAGRYGSTAVGRFLAQIGKVPLFYYVVHLFVLRFTALPVALYRFGKSGVTEHPLGYKTTAMLGLWAALTAWLVTIVVLYPLAIWYGRVKRSGRYPWLRYL